MKTYRIRHNIICIGTFMGAILMLIGCSGAEYEYSNKPCRFVFNMNTHANSAALRSAVGGTGVFCRVTKTLSGGAQYYSFSTNQGLSDKVIYTAEDQRTTVIIGINNSIILGYGNLDNPAVFYGFDGECPNCYDPDALPRRSYPLEMNSAGIATCNTCHRKYNLNTGGNLIEGDRGSKLTRYHAAYSAAGIVTVTN